MLSRNLTNLFLMTLVLLLNGCGGSGGDDAFQGNFFPTEPGSRWIYQTQFTPANSTTATTSTILQKLAETELVDGKPAFVMHTLDPQTGSTLYNTYYRITAEGVQLVSPESLNAIDLMRFPLRTGAQVVTEDVHDLKTLYDHDLDGQNEVADKRTVIQVKAVEKVLTPAGTFSEAICIETDSRYTLHLSASGKTQVTRFVQVSWYAEGVGEIKSVQTVYYPDADGKPGVIGSIYTQTLQAYRVGSRSTDSTPPVITDITPAADAFTGSKPEISVSFSEPMDQSSLRNVIQLLGVGNIPITLPAPVYANGKLSFSTDSLRPGQYTIIVPADVSDLLGNRLGETRSQQFTVDIDGPQLMSNSLGYGGANIPLDTTISLTFSEPLNAAALLGRISSYPGNDWSPIGLKNDGADVVVTLPANLTPGMSYQVLLTGIEDQHGNSGGSLGFNFTLDHGQFRGFVNVHTGSVPSSVAIADLDADGRKDVVTVTGQSFESADNLAVMVFRQQADGTLGTVRQYPFHAAFGCPPPTVAVGDMNGDAKPEILVGKGSCGIEILASNAQGDWATSRELADPIGSRVRVADLNGDGKTDIAALSMASNSIIVWTQGVNGVLGRTELPLKSFGWSHLRIADVNDDRRADVIVARYADGPEDAVGVLFQNAAGGFGDPVHLSTGDSNRIVSLNVGDTDGDGLNDILILFDGNSPSSRLGTFSQDHAGGFNPIRIQPSYDIPGASAVADVDQDGRQDLVVAHDAWQAVGVYPQTASGELAAEEIYMAPYYIGDMAVDDINGDGFPDIVLADVANGNLAVFYNRRSSHKPSADAKKASRIIRRNRSSSHSPVNPLAIPPRLEWLYRYH